MVALIMSFYAIHDEDGLAWRGREWTNMSQDWLAGVLPYIHICHHDDDDDPAS